MMKKIIQISVAAAFIFITAFINPLKAQDTKKEMMMMAKNYENDYNKKNAKALQEFYTKDAVRTNIDGTTINGSKALGDSLNNEFKNSNVTLKITVDKCVTESDGAVTVTGTFHAMGASKTGEKIDQSGTFTNTTVKENGHWKISKSALTKM